MNGDLDPLKTAALVERMRNGEQAAFQIVIKHWHKRIFNYALRYGNDAHFAHEVVQKTFIQMFEKIDQLKDPAKLRSWLYRIASNCCASEGRMKKRLGYVSLEEDGPFRDPLNPATSYERKEMQGLVMDVLQRIPAEQRRVIIMKEYEGLKFREIAEALGESENTIKSRMYYGLDAMKKILIHKKLSKEMYYE